LRPESRYIAARRTSAYESAGSWHGRPLLRRTTCTDLSPRVLVLYVLLYWWVTPCGRANAV